VNPRNIRLNERNHPKLCGFGSARVWTSSLKSPAAVDIFSCGKMMQESMKLPECLMLKREWETMIADCLEMKSQGFTALKAFRKMAAIGLLSLNRNEKLIDFLKQLPAIDVGSRRSEFTVLSTPPMRVREIEFSSNFLLEEDLLRFEDRRNEILGRKLMDIGHLKKSIDNSHRKIESLMEKDNRLENERRKLLEPIEFERGSFEYKRGFQSRGIIARMRAIDSSLVVAGLSSNDPATLFGKETDNSVYFPSGSVMDLSFDREISSDEFDSICIFAVNEDILNHLTFFRISPEGDELEVLQHEPYSVGTRVWKFSIWHTIDVGKWSSADFRLKTTSDMSDESPYLKMIEMLLNNKPVLHNVHVRIITTYFSLERFHVWPPVKQRVSSSIEPDPKLTIEFIKHELLVTGVPLDRNPGFIFVSAGSNINTMNPIGCLTLICRDQPLYLSLEYVKPDYAQFYSRCEFKPCERVPTKLWFHHFDLYGELQIKTS
jgi:serine/threonine protein kinase